MTARYAVSKQISLGLSGSILVTGKYLDETAGKSKVPTYLYAMIELKQ